MAAQSEVSRPVSNFKKTDTLQKKTYLCSFADQRETERQVSELLRHKMIQESFSVFASPVTMAYKKNGRRS